MQKNWGYVSAQEDINELYITKGQYMGGNIVGIIVEPNELEKQVGDICNAKTYDFPVRYEVVYENDMKNIEDRLKQIVEIFEKEGCRCIASTGGLLGKYQNMVANSTELLVMMTPLIMIPFCLTTISSRKKLLIVSENEITVEQEIAAQMGYVHCTQIEYAKVLGNGHIQNIHDEEPQWETIGVIIWDSQRKCNIKTIPVYGMCDVIYFTKLAVAQKPYEGFL